MAESRTDYAILAWSARLKLKHDFRGDGAGETLRQPSINSSTVYGSLFSRSALPAVFRDMDKGTMEVSIFWFQARRILLFNSIPCRANHHITVSTSRRLGWHAQDEVDSERRQEAVHVSFIQWRVQKKIYQPVWNGTKRLNNFKNITESATRKLPISGKNAGFLGGRIPPSAWTM